MGLLFKGGTGVRDRVSSRVGVSVGVRFHSNSEKRSQEVG